MLARDEENQPTTQESMFNYVRLSDGGIDRLNDVKSEVEILAEIGKKLLPDQPIDFDHFMNHDCIRETIAATIPGMQQLKDISVAKEEFHIRGRIMHEPEFKTESKKARFIIHSIPNDQHDNIYDFVLASVRSEGQFNSIIYEETDSYRHNADRQSVFISAEDMQRLGIQAGELINLVSSVGRMDNVKACLFDLPKGNLLAYYPEANVLTEHKLDPRSKTPNFKSVAVRIECVER